jgi:hypothetical protein
MNLDKSANRQEHHIFQKDRYYQGNIIFKVRTSLSVLQDDKRYMRTLEVTYIGKMTEMASLESYIIQYI